MGPRKPTRNKLTQTDPTLVSVEQFAQISLKVDTIKCADQASSNWSETRTKFVNLQMKQSNDLTQTKYTQFRENIETDIMCQLCTKKAEYKCSCACQAHSVCSAHVNLIDGDDRKPCAELSKMVSWKTKLQFRKKATKYLFKSVKLNNKRLLIDPCHENQQRLNKAVKTRNELNPYHVVPPVVQAHHNVDNGNNRKRRSED